MLASICQLDALAELVPTVYAAADAVPKLSYCLAARCCNIKQEAEDLISLLIQLFCHAQVPGSLVGTGLAVSPCRKMH
eukprot:1161300-Pelagomonas_calceolata.AAC.3